VWPLHGSAQISLGGVEMKIESDNKLTSVLCGVAGEYFVAAELSRRGYVASLTLRNTRGIDVLASNSDATKTVGIQVKTNQTDRRECTRRFLDPEV
jgi:hypothetical protein